MNMSNENEQETVNVNINSSEDLKLTYGSIIRIESRLNKYDDDLFFIHYVAEDTITVFSKLKSEFIIFPLSKNGDINDSDITGIKLLLYNTDGYANQNGFEVGKSLMLKMKDGSSYKGKIIQQIEDMIIIETEMKDENTEELIRLHIDFHYGGLDPEYGIEKIILYETKTRKKTTDKFFIPLSAII